MPGRHERPGMNTMDKVLIVVLVTVVAFVAVCFVYAWYEKPVQGELIVGFFGLVTGECGAMGWIKTTKERREARRWQLQDRAHDEERQDRMNNGLGT